MGAGVGVVILLKLLVWAVIATRKLRKTHRSKSSATSPYDFDGQSGNSGYKAELHSEQHRAGLNASDDVNKTGSKITRAGSTTVCGNGAHELNA